MDTTNTIDRTIFANMVLNAASRLNAEKAGVDSLNVFPVPDGDTGTNMFSSSYYVSKGYTYRVHSTVTIYKSKGGAKVNSDTFTYKNSYK